MPFLHAGGCLGDLWNNEVEGGLFCDMNSRFFGRLVRRTV